MTDIPLPTLDPCPFCAYLRGEAPCAFVARGRKVSVFLNPRQYERGALLVVPNAHVESLLSASDEEFHAVQAEARRCAGLLVQQLGAAGVNVYQNAGVPAGQTVPHYHVHVVPRYTASDPARRFHEADYDVTPVEELERIAAHLNEPLRRTLESVEAEAARGRPAIIVTALISVLLIALLVVGRCSGGTDDATAVPSMEGSRGPNV